jgi:uncharacterized iron-regulated membrane protein
VPILELRKGGERAKAPTGAIAFGRGRLASLGRALRRRRTWRKVVFKLHLWTSFAAGIVLLVIVLSGVALLLRPEINQVVNAPLYESTDAAERIRPEQAVDSARRELKGYGGAASVILDRGVYAIYNRNFSKQAFVDPGTGEVNGTYDEDAGVFGFLRNLHMCGLGCKNHPGYLPVLDERVKVLGNKLRVGGLVLGAAALVLGFLALSGLVLWWPGIKRFARGLTIRRKSGAYSTNYDLHKVFGFAALPFLLMWAVTGAGFEFKQVKDAWYGVLPGGQPAEEEVYAPFASRPGPKKSEDRDIGPRAAERAALAAVPGSEFISVTYPAPDDRKSYYEFWLDGGLDSYEHYTWPGTHEVTVDRWSGRAEVVYPANGHPTLAQRVWEDWNYAVHAGTPVGWIPRLGWVAFGLAPLLLAVTGVSMWWIKRRKRGRKRRGPPAGEPA